jgi:hypothetical protein
MSDADEEHNEGDGSQGEPQIEFDDAPRVSRTTRRTTLDLAAVSRNATRQRMAFGSPIPQAVQGFFGFDPQEEESASEHQGETQPDPQRRGATVPKKKMQVRVGGQLVTVNSARNPSSSARVCLWPKLERPNMPPEVKLAFQSKATGYVLSKTNKLSVPVVQHKADTILTEIHNLQSQLKVIKSHLTTYDLGDVFEIVLPLDVLNTPEINPERFDLFSDYAKLTADLVANSNAWYNLWLSEQPYIRENMTFTYTLFKNNTEESLWAKCLEDYEEFHPDQHGGPLMLYLILRRIQNVSETALEHLKLKIRNLKISELEGEDVDVAVSLIKSTYAALKSASTPDRDQVPDDFPSVVLSVFQTTSVPEFNACFYKKQVEARTLADEVGGQPVWPTIQQLTTLATNTYSRLKTSGDWDVPAASKIRVNVAGNPGSDIPLAKPRPKGQRSCWNCGATDHIASGCKLPRNQALFDANKKAFEAAKDRRKKGPKRRVNKETGKPEIRNKRGLYVVDQKRLRQQERKVALEQGARALAAIQLLSAQNVPSTTTQVEDDVEHANLPDANSAFKAQVEALQATFKSLSS